MHDDQGARPDGTAAAPAGAHRPSLRRLLLRNLIYTLAAVLLSGGVGVVGMLVANHTGDELFEEIVPARRNNLLMLQHMLDAETGLRGYVETGDEAYLTPFEQGRADFPRAVADQRALPLPAGAERLVTIQAELGSRWFREYAEPVRQGRDLDPEVGKVIFDEYRATSRELADVLQVDRDRLSRRLDLIPILAIASISVVVFGFATVAVVQSRRATRLAVEPLERLRATVAALEGGDRRARSSVRATAEIEAVSHAVNLLAEENQRHTIETERRLQTGRAIQTITGRIHQALDAGTVLGATVEDLGRLLGVRRVLVLALDGPGLRTEALADWSAPGERSHPTTADTEADAEALSLLARPPYRQLLESDGGFYLDDVAAGGLPDDIAFVLRDQGATALGICPVHAGTEVLGAIVLLDGGGPRAWTYDDRRCVADVANELGTALTHARLYQRELDMVEQLRSLDQSKDDFVSTVSHELRTPLTSIVGYLELLRDGDAGAVGPEQDRMLAVIERNTERLLGLIADLLLLSKIDSGHLGLDQRPVRLDGLVAEAVAAVAPQTSAKAIEVVVEVDLGAREVHGDPAQLEQVLLNLLSNAAKFTPDGGGITVTGGPVDGGVEVVVADTGIGIPEQEQAELFNRFFRSSSALASAIPGTGLGLAIVHGIVERHGGRIDVESAVGVGTRVTVWLPCAPGAAPGRDPLAPASEDLAPAGGPPR